MTTTTILTMVVICGLVWGGFATLLVFALRSESAKRRAGVHDATTGGADGDGGG